MPMKIEKFTHYQEMNGDAYVMDYTKQTQSRKKVCITSTPPEDITYFHLINQRKIAYWAVNFEENPSVLKGSDQCECMFASSKATSKGWICFVELKYCLEYNIERNATHAFEQLHTTLDQLVKKDIIDHRSHRIYFNISMPDHSDKAPFIAFRATQDALLTVLEEYKVHLLGYNEALILNEGFLKVPKENL